MNKEKREEKKKKLTGELEARIAFLQSQLENVTKEKNAEIDRITEEMETLILQSDALINFKIK